MMLPLKRIFAAGMLAALGITGFAAGASAQGELKLIAPAAPGGGWDQTARAMQAALVASGAAKSAQVVNVPGAGGTVGLAQFVNSAKGDGAQLLVNGLVMVGAIITNKAPVNLDMVTPIARLTGEYVAIVVPASSPIKDIKELAAALKADPAKVTWAGGSAGGVDHICMGLFAKAVGADATKINYIPFSGGGEALAAMLGGKVTAGVSGYGEVEGQVKSGKLRLLAITSPKRLPNVDGPTLKEQGIDVEVINWRSVFAAPGITPEQRATLEATVDKMAKSPAWAETLKAKGWDDAYLKGDEFATFIKNEQTRVHDVLASIGLAN
jgi:putative tricarboxylic transport membrane protein